MLQNTSSRKPQRTVICIDCSPSMLEKDYPPSRFDAAKKAAISYVKTRAQLHPQSEVAVVAYCESAAILVPFTRLSENMAAIVKTIEECSWGGGTDITQGLVACARVIFPLKETVVNFFRSFVQEVDQKSYDAVVLLSDGNHVEKSDPRNIASHLKERGVTIETVGIGRRNDIDEELLKAIATKDPNGTIHYKFLGDGDTLVKHYERLANSLVK